MKIKETCPCCHKKLKVIERKPTKREKEFFRKMSSRLLENHVDLWGTCDCGYQYHETVVNGTILFASEFYDKKEGYNDIQKKG